MLCNFVLIEEYTTVAIDYYPTKCMKHNKKKKTYQNIETKF